MQLTAVEEVEAPPLREKRYYSDDDLCEMFDVSKATLARWRASGMIGYLKTPGSQIVRYTRAHLAEFEKRHDHKTKGRHRE